MSTRNKSSKVKYVVEDRPEIKQGAEVREILEDWKKVTHCVISKFLLGLCSLLFEMVFGKLKITPPLQKVSALSFKSSLTTLQVVQPLISS